MQGYDNWKLDYPKEYDYLPQCEICENQAESHDNPYCYDCEEKIRINNKVHELTYKDLSLTWKGTTMHDLFKSLYNDGIESVILTPHGIISDRHNDKIPYPDNVEVNGNSKLYGLKTSIYRKW